MVPNACQQDTLNNKQRIPTKVTRTAITRTITLLEKTISQQKVSPRQDLTQYQEVKP